ncbi:PQQ-dependent sugar dehydrogenase [Aquimarina agarivorans]|uniref:PQQ-dependent sugar dehydrogenase n=1 Tax=Aquimarina agarivorans TaxID=980584 RepID=UPI000248E6B2|nr:PQQ-dependent sugar dehydrogenase [Aquimarina agarivorans]
MYSFRTLKNNNYQLNETLFFGLFILPFLFCNNVFAQIETQSVALVHSNESFTTEIVFENENIIWGFTWLPDNSILACEKEGRLLRYTDGKVSTIKNVPEITNRGQGGLLDIKLHPEYKNNGWLYFTYASPAEEGGSNTALARAKLEGDRLKNLELLYKATPNSPKSHHFGSRIAFDALNNVYFSIGDRGNRDANPQDITRDCGKVYRLSDRGSIPEDNPFVNVKNAKKAIYSYGHRNPQGMTTHPKTGKLWIHEHGPKGGDEINILNKGSNYGWPIITYGLNYDGSTITTKTHKKGMEQPFYYWTPSIAPSGMSFVTSDYYPNWKNHLLVGSLKFEYLELLKINDNRVYQRIKLLEDFGRVRDIQQGPDGYIYLSVEGIGIVKIIKK